jgi:hypothetical protein
MERDLVGAVPCLQAELARIVEINPLGVRGRPSHRTATAQLKKQINLKQCP